MRLKMRTIYFKPGKTPSVEVINDVALSVECDVFAGCGDFVNVYARYTHQVAAVVEHFGVATILEVSPPIRGLKF